MLLREIPGLPFNPDPNSATEWLNGLPIQNTAECCRLLFPVVYALRMAPIETRLRVELLETCRPAVLGVVRALAGLFIGRPLPLEPKPRKMASYACAFHLELAETYRERVLARDFIPLFARNERATILSRGLDHLGQVLLRTAQSYELPPKGLWFRAVELYGYAEKHGFLDELVKYALEPSVSPRIAFQRILLFRLAAPGRLDQQAMQRLFDRITAHAGAPEFGEGGGDGQTLFQFEPQQSDIVMPVVALKPPAPGTHFASGGKLAAPPRTDAGGPPGPEEFARVLPRLGRPLALRDTGGGYRTELAAGFRKVVLALSSREIYRLQGAPGADDWPRLHAIEFAPLDDSDREDRKPPSVPEDPFGESGPEPGTVEIVPTALPGYHLIDTGSLPFRVGLPVGLSRPGDWLRVGVVRGAQLQGGRIWHSVEILGTFPRLVTVSGENFVGGLRTGLVLDDRENGGEISLIVTPVRWRSGDSVRVEWFRQRESFRIGRLLEINADFCHFALVPVGPAKVS
jgi:hypothetical protein